MKQITTLFAGVIFSFVLIAQQTTSVTAGIGCGDISIGMTEIQVKAILGDSMEEKTFKEEMTAFWHHNRTVAIDSITQFVLGFDKCLVLDDDLNRKWPIFKIFLLKGKVNCMIVTSYLPDNTLAEKVLINENIRFEDDAEKCKKYFGDQFIKTPYPGYDEYLYYNKGIHLLFKEGVLKTFKLFKANPGFPALIAARAKLLKAQFQEIDKEKGGGFNWPD
ncbi:MAG: hypothetical protein KA399_01880 [Chitinophagaceae bacterium]|nr:hypothetical protein [Chitinophagaceae bacterium]